jgi:hypothetical protein
LFDDESGCVQGVFGDILNIGFVFFRVVSGVSREHKNRFDPEVFSGFYVCPFVPDDPGIFVVDWKIFFGIFQHSGIGLAAGNGCLFCILRGLFPDDREKNSFSGF